MTDTLTVKDKGPRALFLCELSWNRCPLQPSYNNKIIRSQARKLACLHYKKTSRSQALELETDRKNYSITWHFMLELCHLKQNIRI